MSKLKYIAIDSLKQEDLTALFGLICKDILLKKPYEVIKEVRGLADEECFDREIPSANDILEVISIYDIAFELKLNYISTELKAEVVAPEPKNEGLEEDKGSSEMYKQREAIKLKVEEKKEDKVKEDDIPDFK